MRVLAWNLNHRAARRDVPEWIAAAIASFGPDAVILTEYVEGSDHRRFLAELAARGLAHVSLTERTNKQNQLLIASREPQRRGDLAAPAIHPAVPPNALNIVLENSGLHILGFRMPAFTGPERPLKRVTWEWLLGAAAELRDRPAVIAGDFNTAPGDAVADCGDCLEVLLKSGWHLARPAAGYSWRHAQSGVTRQIDHAFLAPALAPGRAEYSWKFHDLAPDAASGKVGLPDHAMLLTDFEQVSTPAVDAAQPGAAGDAR
jgi:endonuclease/exonuclease/phosphatase family metal-dependent hydrolase